MKKKLYLFLIIFVFSIALSACISNPSYLNKSRIDITKSKIAIIPFLDFNSAEGNNSGELVRNIFESRLIVKGFNVVEIEKTVSAIDYSILKKREFPEKWFIETGNTLGVDYILYGSVHDYRTYQNVTSLIYIFSWLEVTSSVGITARLVSCKTGEVVWSGSYARTSYTYNDAATEVINTLIRTIKRNSL